MVEYQQETILTYGIWFIDMFLHISGNYMQLLGFPIHVSHDFSKKFSQGAKKTTLRSRSSLSATAWAFHKEPSISAHVRMANRCYAIHDILIFHPNSHKVCPMTSLYKHAVINITPNRVLLRPRRWKNCRLVLLVPCRGRLASIILCGNSWVFDVWDKSWW